MNTVVSRLGSSSAGFMIPTTVNHVSPMYSWMCPLALGIWRMLAAWAPSTTVGNRSLLESRKWPEAIWSLSALTSPGSAASTPIPPVCSEGTYGVRSTLTFETW